MAVAIGSFPIERWAEEVRDLLRARGVDSDVAYAGPRAYEVLVSDEDGDRAGEIVDSVGYLSCPVAGGAAAMSGVLEWRDPEAEDEDETLDIVRRIGEDALETLANEDAARAWSTPSDDLTDKYEDFIVVAEFGDAIAVNGDLREKYPEMPHSFEEISDEGGTVPSSEAYVMPEDLIARTIFVLDREYPKLKVDRKSVSKVILEKIVKGYRHDEIPVSVSGETTLYAQKKVVREKYDLGQYIGKRIFPGGIVQEWYYNEDSAKAYKVHFDDKRKKTIVLEYDVSDLDLDPEKLTPSMLQDRLGTRKDRIVRVNGVTKG